MSSGENNPRPTVFFLALGDKDFFDEMYGRLSNAIAAKARIQRASETGAALRYLDSNSPNAIFITDAAIVESNNLKALDKVSSYVRNGGTVVIGGLFGSFVAGDKVGFMFRRFGLEWDRGDYHRTDVHLNKELSEAHGFTARLALSYSQKAVFLKGVPKEAALYLPNSDSVTQSMVFPSEKVDTTQTPVAYARVGEGWLGFVGDVNGEEASDKVILAMCGL